MRTLLSFRLSNIHVMMFRKSSQHKMIKINIFCDQVYYVFSPTRRSKFTQTWPSMTFLQIFTWMKLDAQDYLQLLHGSSWENKWNCFPGLASFVQLECPTQRWGISLARSQSFTFGKLAWVVNPGTPLRVRIAGWFSKQGQKLLFHFEKYVFTCLF